MSRHLALNRGKTGSVQRYSESRDANPDIQDLLLQALRPDVSAPRRLQTYADPTRCSQFACRFNDSFGFFTRPTIETTSGGDLVLGSFSDTIGYTVPVAVQLCDFHGFFTTLIREEDAIALQLEVHPTRPETVPPVLPDNAEADEADATMVRLHFGQIDTDGDRPVIVALPCFLPIGPGQTFPDPLPADSATDFRQTFRLFEVWRRGVQYAATRNGGNSVTLGGPLFHLPALDPVAGTNPAFSRYPIQLQLPQRPLLLEPTSAENRAVVARLHVFADDTWITLGQNLETEAPVPASGGLTGDQIRSIIEPVMQAHSKPPPSSKDVEQAETASDMSLRYSVALASLPTAEDTDQDRMTLPTLSAPFMAILAKSKPVVAAQALQEQVSNQIDIASASDKSLDTGITFDPNACTTAFANCIRSFHWLLDPLQRSAHAVVQSRLGLLHFLPPDRAQVVFSGSLDASAGPIVLSHIADDKAQLEASKASSLYTGGRLQCKQDLFEMLCNLRVLLLVITPAADESLLWVKLNRYLSLLQDRNGRLFLDTYRTNLGLFVHLFQDLQHITTNFLALSSRKPLRDAAKTGAPISTANYL